MPQGELELLRQLRGFAAPAGGDLIIAAGEDDAACWLEVGGGFTVASCDTFVEGVHFDLGRQKPEAIGWRSLAFSLGDLAAKGAAPTYALASISIPRRWPDQVVLGIYAGMSELAAQVGLRLVGGDTTAAPHDGSLSLSLLGRTAHRPLARAAAQPGWLIGVSGPLGGAGVDWERPLPQLARGSALCQAGACCGDISDGLLRELDKFAAAAGVGARLDLGSVPLAPGVAALDAISSGEEVELVCVGPEAAMSGLHLVGELTADGRVVVVGPGGIEVEVAKRGYDHFA
ncbi:MAG TPA: thiamine-phosphate kinase [Candidatus Acidoferrales bacterium]|nr:thiamine-phosphate kinase [Candidatus Acidoferrales bacterium]